MERRMMRATVTGGAGFIGSHVVDQLVGHGVEVVVLDDLSAGYEANVHPAADLVVGDVADPAVVAGCVSGCDLVVHLAAHRAVLRSVERPLETNRVNVEGTLHVLEASRQAGVRRVVCASSSSLYGGEAPLPTAESAPLTPKSPYAVTKLAGEEYARVFFELFGLETVSLRFFNVYGPRQRPDSRYAAVIPLFIDALRHNRAPEVHGDGLQSRDFSYIGDVVNAVLAASSAPAEACAGKAYNVSGGRRYTLLEMLDILEEHIGNRPGRHHVEPRAGDVRHSEADITAARRDLGYDPSVSLPEGLRTTVEWFEAPERMERLVG
jgi:UDP-glucose 4-epimerase